MTMTDLYRGVRPVATQTACDLYLRLSDSRNENGSFVDREAKVRVKAEQLGWAVRRVVIENDLTSGRSASAFKRRKIGTDANGKPIMRVWRPGFQSVLDDFSAGIITAILAEDLDRVMRDEYDCADLLAAVRACGGWADSLSGSLKLTAGGTDTEQMMCRVACAMASKSSADTARRVADGRARTASHGRNGGGRRPYGFLADGLTVDEVEAAELRKMADQVLVGEPLASIARGLNEREVLTVLGNRWTPSGVKEALSKPRCAGILVHTDSKTGITAEASRLPGKPILPEETWKAVLTRMDSPTVTWTDNRGIRRSADRRHDTIRAPRWLGTSIYRCVCGTPMSIASGREREPTYICKLRPKPEGTTHVRRNAMMLDDFVAAKVIARMSLPDAADLAVTAPAGVDVNALRLRIKDLGESKKALLRMFTNHQIDEADMVTETAEIREELVKLEQTLAAQTPRSPLTPLIGAADVAGVWESMSLGDRRAAVDKLMIVTILPLVTSPLSRPCPRGEAPAGARCLRLDGSERKAVHDVRQTRRDNTFDEGSIKIEWR